MRGKRIHVLAAAGVLALFGGACTSGDDTDDTDAPATTGEAPSGTDAGTSAPTETTEATEVQTSGSTLDKVKSADVVRCGTRDALPGFAVLTPEGDHVGFDADFCRVIAAAVLGDATKVEFVDLETADRFTALQSGEIDVL